MNPFSIVCKSCAAKLKVAKASAVGQILACPKCGTMLRITAPKGWVAPPAPAESQSSMDIPADSLDATADTLGGMFEDIDDILGDPKSQQRKNPQSAAKQNPNRPSQQSARPAARAPQPNRAQPTAHPNSTQRRKPVAATAPSNVATQAVLPNDQWTSDATRKKKRLVTTIVLGLGSVFLLGTITIAVLTNLPDDKPADVQVADAANPDAQAIVPDDGNLLDNSSNDQEQELLDDNDPANPPPLVNDAPLVDDSPPLTGDTPPGDIGSEAAPPIDLTGTPPSITTDQAGSDSTSPDNSSTDQNPLTSKPRTPFGTAPPNTPFGPTGNTPNQIDVSPQANTRKPSIGMVESFESDLGELAALLEEQGTSMLDLKDLAASIRDRQLIGLAKYIVLQPEPSKLDMVRQMETPIAGVQFEGTPLSRVARTLNAITGVPITVDAHSIVAANKDPNPKVSATVTSENLATALTEISHSVGLEITSDANGFLIGIFPGSEPTEAKFSVPNFSEADEMAQRRILETIKILVEPKSWIRPNEPDQIELVGNEIVVKCPARVQMMIGSLLKKMEASHTLSQSPADVDALNMTRSRRQSASTGLLKDPKMIHSIRKEISGFFDHFQTLTGLTVFIDWPSVSSEGWTAQTILPGNIREATAAKTITEVARSMNLTHRAENETTIVLTTFAQAAQTIDLEVYPIAQLVPEKLSPELLHRLVTEALGTQLQSENVRYTYQPDTRCLIVSAPQHLQEQVEGLVKRIHEDLIPNNQAKQSPGLTPSGEGP
ncbi:MAG: hypothetical protein ACI87E_002867 [Mariniblastus sp.]